MRLGYQKPPGQMGWSEVEQGSASFCSLHSVNHARNRLQSKMVVLVDQARLTFKSLVPEGAPYESAWGDALLLMHLVLEALKKENNVAVQLV